MTAACCWCGAPLLKVGKIWWCGSPQQDCRVRQARHAQFQTDSRGQVKEWLYVPLPKQTVWHEAVYQRDITKFLIGGAAGPGKSTCIRRILYEFAKQVPGFHALILRRSIPDLKKSHLRFLPYEVTQLGGDWKEGDKIAVFPHKGQPEAVIRAGHFEDASAMDDYLSAEFDVIAPDEIVTFDQDITLELFSRARSTNEALFALRGRPAPDPEDELDGSFVLAGSNPGGRLWVKDHWITKAPDPEEFPNYNPARWAFYDAKLQDNPYLKASYRQNLRDMRETRRRQLEEGDWDVFEGQAFGEWQAQRHGQPWHVGRFEDLYAA
jgi:phage terminase large subunit